MPKYSFEIGTSLVGMENLEELTTPVTPPKSTYQDYSEAINLGDGTQRGMGAPIAQWRWGYMPEEQRDSLRTFCTGKSAIVYIKTLTNDEESSTRWKAFQAIMIWPETEEKDASRRLDFVIDFRQLIEQIIEE